MMLLIFQNVYTMPSTICKALKPTISVYQECFEEIKGGEGVVGVREEDIQRLVQTSSDQFRPVQTSSRD